MSEDDTKGCLLVSLWLLAFVGSVVYFCVVLNGEYAGLVPSVLVALVMSAICGAIDDNWKTK